MKRLRQKEKELAGALKARGLAAGDILWYESVDSTMDAAFGIEGGAVRDRTLVVSETQTSGRGRFGRKWYSTADDLLFSLVLTDYDFEIPYAMVAALAVFKAFARYVQGVRLKWVNDILWRDGRKMAGILVEERRGRTVVGIGVNLNSARFPAEVRERATSLFIETGKIVPKGEFLLAIMGELIPFLNECGAGGIGGILSEWEELSEMRGKKVAVRSGDREYSGTVVGLNGESGALILHAPDGEIELYDGSLRYLDN